MITKSEQRRLEDYFNVEFTSPWPGGYIVYQNNLFVVAVPEECTFGQVRNLLSHTVDRSTLARNIVAMLFWRWREAMHLSEQIRGHQPDYLTCSRDSAEVEAYNAFVSAKNTYYGNWG